MREDETSRWNFKGLRKTVEEEKMKMPHFQHGLKSGMLRNFDKCFQKNKKYDNNNNVLYSFQQEIKDVVQPCILKQNQKFNCSILIIKSRCSRNPSFISLSPATPVKSSFSLFSATKNIMIIDITYRAHFCANAFWSSKNITQTQEQRPELPTVTHLACK